MTGRLLTEQDHEDLARLLAYAARRPVNTAGRGGESPGVDVVHELAPEFHVARTPAGGIPALLEGFTYWTGTGTETHSGTGTEILYDDEPGEADCDVWFTERTSSGTPRLLPQATHPRRVLNLSTTAVPGDTWVLIARTKEGEWYVVRGGGGGVGVCGNPDELEDGYSGTGTGTTPTGRCPVRTDNERTYPEVEQIKFDQDSFQVTPGGECGVDDSDRTGTGTAADERKVTVRTVGHTGEVQVGVGDPVICDTLCIVAETKRFLCVVRGLVYGYYDGETAEEQCEGGT